MGYLSHIVVALAAVVAADLGFEGDLDAPWAAICLLPIPHLLGRLTRSASLAGRFRRADWLGRLLALSPMLLLVVAVSLFGWQRAVRTWIAGGPAELDWPEPALLLSLVPFFAYELAAIDARARLVSARLEGIRRQRRFQVRLLLSAVVPLAAYLLLAGSIGIDEVVRAHVEEVALFHAAFAALSIALFAMFLPTLLRNTWETARMEPGLARSVLEAVAARADFRCKGLFVWKTGNLMANAAIVGFLPGHRSVLFSDALLAQLPPRELAAVFAHEIGHAKRHHVLVFAAWTLVVFLAGDLLLSRVLPALSLGEAFLVWAGPDVAFMAVVIVLAGVWYALFGYLSRRFELDADLVSYEITGDPAALVRALEEVGGAHTSARSSWRHFSTAQRVLFLHALDREPAVGERLRVTLRTWSRAGFALFSLLLVLEAVSLGTRVPEQLVDVELRLGRYDRAVARAEAAYADGAVLELAQRAAAAAGADGELSELELDQLADHALRQGDLDNAYGWLELGARRGIDRHLEVLLALEALISESPDGAGALARDLADELRAVD